MSKGNLPKLKMPLGQSPDAFSVALREIALRIGASTINPRGTNISAFKTNYSTVLDQASKGSLEVVTRGRRRYLVLTEDQIMALTRKPERSRTIGEIFAELPTLPATGVRPRAVSTATHDHHRLPPQVEVAPADPSCPGSVISQSPDIAQS